MKRLSHCCAEDAAGVSFNRSSLTLAEPEESSLVADDIMTQGLRDVEGVDDEANAVSSDVVKVHSRKA